MYFFFVEIQDGNKPLKSYKIIRDQVAVFVEKGTR